MVRLDMAVPELKFSRILPRSAAVIVACCLLLSAGAAIGADARHFLWRISKDGNSLYLVGSVHALRPSDYPLPPAMESAFQTAGTLVEEVDLSHLDAESLQLQMQRRGAYPAGQSLRAALPPELYRKVTERAHKLGMDMDDVDSMRPWLVSIVLLDTQLENAGFDPASGVDIHFADEAMALHKPVLGLEDLKFQMGLLANLPEAVQRDALQQSLDESADFNTEMQALLAAWHGGDTAALEKIMRQDFGDYQQLYQPLLVSRNLTWMPRLESMLMSGKRYFVVVGALHMVGPDGLLAHFEKDGYKVEQL